MSLSERRKSIQEMVSQVQNPSLLSLIEDLIKDAKQETSLSPEQILELERRKEDIEQGKVKLISESEFWDI